MENIKDINNIVCDWEKVYKNTTERSEKLFGSIINESNFFKISEKYVSALKNLIWEDTYIDAIISTEKLYNSIVNENDILSICDKYISMFEETIGVEWYQEYLKDEENHKQDGHNFNVFYFLRDECDFNLHETVHSKLLKFLLNPYASHGQGNKFLVDFLTSLHIEKPDEGSWRVVTEQGKIDILLERIHPKSVIIIENKSNWASDQSNQLYRYWHQAIYAKTREVCKDFYSKNNDRYQIIYLVPNAGKQLPEQSYLRPNDWDVNLPETIPMKIKTLFFNEFIQDWLEKCKQSLEKNHRIREYIAQYQMLCKYL